MGYSVDEFLSIPVFAYALVGSEMYYSNYKINRIEPLFFIE